MTQLRFDVQTPAAPEAVLAALTDFTQRRPSLWPALDPDVYQVEQLGPTSAIVREGQRSPKLWALEEYDWSVPGTVTWTARESNFCAPGSFMSATVTAAGDGGSTVGFVWSRTGTTLKGKMIVAMMRATKAKPLAKELSKALHALPTDRPSG